MAPTQNVPRSLSLEVHYVQYTRSPSVSTYRINRIADKGGGGSCRPAAFQNSLVSLMQTPFLRSVVKWVMAPEKNRTEEREVGVFVYMTAKMLECICAGISSVFLTTSHSWFTWGFIDVSTAFPPPETFSKDISWIFWTAAGLFPPFAGTSLCFLTCCHQQFWKARNWGMSYRLQLLYIYIMAYLSRAFNT